MTTAWPDPQREPITWEMFLDIDEETRRDLEIVDGYVVPREQRSREHQKVATRPSLALETAAVQQMRKSGGTESLAGRAGHYVHVKTAHRDMGPTALRISDPFPVEILWAELEVAPQV